MHLIFYLYENKLSVSKERKVGVAFIQWHLGAGISSGYYEDGPGFFHKKIEEK